jgi:uncharacterized repeat protein (TIGR03803 family)
MKSTRNGKLRMLSTLLLFVTMMRPGFVQAQLSELYAFQYDATTISNYPDGETPIAELIQGADGNYYTTTNAGGAGACPGVDEGTISGCGAVVKISASGAFSVLYSFPYDSSNNTAPNGLYPQAGLVQGPDGNFYGVAAEGGTGGTSCADTTGLSGCGTVFKLTKSGTLTVLHSFCGGSGCGSLATDGAEPTGRMVFGTNGDLYGTTQIGGVYNGFYNQGTIFTISTSGAYKVLHVFTGNQGPTVDGANPVAGLTFASNGNFYGTTEYGGTFGDGTVFKMTPSGTVTVLYSFANNDPNGMMPKGALVEASNGNLYGTCYGGGANSRGTAFRISLSGKFQKIYDFTAATGNLGYDPAAGLIQASDRNLYGTTAFGGPDALGTIYQLTLDGTATLMASFVPSTTGFFATDQLLQGSDGRLYLTLQYNGGSNGDGVQDQGAISVLDASLASPAPIIVTFSPTKGNPGSKVTILGGEFVGTTAVTINGASAAFVVDGSGVITATVPNAPGTGPISISNAGGKTASTKNFTIL